MPLISFQFMLFGIITIGLYFAVPKKRQWIVICVANIVFYAFSGIVYLVYLLFTSLVTFWMALKLEAIAEIGTKLAATADSVSVKTEVRGSILTVRKLLCGVAIVLAMGPWIVLKYTSFFIANVNMLSTWFHSEWQKDTVSWVLPLGISFYTFHAVGYLVDVYRSKYKAERNFAKYFTFLAYFPHITEGPFSRFDKLGRSILEEHSFSYDRLCQGCSRILWGVFKKTVVADKLGIAITTILADYINYSGVYILFAVFGYSIRIYADFSGYMDIVCGFSTILGIDLAENFDQPYFARTIDEFWRRWHITLGKWFKDYVFYPVSMGGVGQKLSKMARKKWGAKMGKLVPGYFALIFVWSATGIWHGAHWSYLVWGYLNLLVILSTMQLSDTYEAIKTKLHIKSDSWIWQMFCILRTFFLVCLLRFFSVGVGLKAVFSMLQKVFFEFNPEVIKNPILLFVGMSEAEVCGVLIGVALMIMVDAFNESGKWDTVKKKCPMVFRNAIYAGLILFIMVLAGGSSDLTGGFMYANF